MANNLILRRIQVTPEFRPLSAVRLVATVDVSTPPTNAGPVCFRGGVGEEVEFQASEWHTFKGVDLSELFVRGTPGDVVTLIGGTWRD